MPQSCLLACAWTHAGNDSRQCRAWVGIVAFSPISCQLQRTNPIECLTAQRMQVAGRLLVNHGCSESDWPHASEESSACAGRGPIRKAAEAPPGGNSGAGDFNGGMLVDTAAGALNNRPITALILPSNSPTLERQAQDRVHPSTAHTSSHFPLPPKQLSGSKNIHAMQN